MARAVTSMSYNRHETVTETCSPLVLGFMTSRNAPCRVVRAALLCCVSAVAFTLTGFAAEPQAKSFDVPAGPAPAALKQFISQSGVQLLYVPGEVKEVQTNAVKGSFTPAEAIGVLLADTGLVSHVADTGAISVSRAIDPNAQRAIAKTESDRPASNRGATMETGADGEKVIKLDTFEVFGSKTLNMDIARTRDDAQPYVVFDQGMLARSGAINLEDFLKRRLTMNTVGMQNSSLAAAVGSASQINLRGLGSSQTLILVDGRRLPQISQVGNPVQPDVNGIPLSAIERIEILPTTASGIYGGGATGGVVNIIMRRDYTGLEIKATYDNTFDTDAAGRRIDLSGGTTLEGGKTNVIFAASFADRNALLVHDRNSIRERRAEVLARSPSFWLSRTTPPLSNTTNIISANGAPLTLKDGTPLNSTYTFVPVGYAGVGTDQGAALVANAGRFNPDLTPGGQTLGGGGESLLNAPDVRSASVSVRRQMGAGWEVFLEGDGSNTRSSFRTVSILGLYTLPATAPANPFSQPITVRAPFPNYLGELSSRHEARRLAAGVIFQLPFRWKGEVDYTWGRTNFRFETSPDVTLAADALVNSGQIPVLRDTNEFPVDLSSVLTSTFFTVAPFRADSHSGTARFGGPVVALPGGEVHLSILLEDRKQSLKEGRQATGGVISIYPARSQKVRSGYAELRTPLLAGAAGGPASLELTLAARYDEYTTRGVTNAYVEGTMPVIARAQNKIGSSNPTVSVKYQAVPSVSLRASYGTGFLPPTVNQLVTTPSTRSMTVIDPRRGGAATVLPTGQVTSGGNPQLKPEKSESWSAGLIFTPTIVRGLRVSIDYTRIEKTDNIFAIGAATLLQNEDLFSSRIVRGAPIPGETFGVGPVTFIDNTLANIARAKVEAVDLALDYSVSLGESGDLDFYAIGTWQKSYTTQLLVTAPTIENVGVAPRDRAGIPVEYKANFGARWSRARWSLGWHATYFHSYLVADPTVAANAPAISAQGNGGRVGSQLYHDVFAEFKFPAARTSGWGRVLDGLEVRVGVNNVFNSEPPFDAPTIFSDFYSDLGDARLANYFVTIKRRF